MVFSFLIRARLFVILFTLLAIRQGGRPVIKSVRPFPAMSEELAIK